MVSRCESGCFRIDSSVRQVCIMSPLLFNGRSDEGDENRNGEEGREWRLAGLLYADDWICVVSRRKT